jgi:hypothetical protein
VKLEQFKSLFGWTQTNDAEVISFIKEKGWEFKNGFIYPSPEDKDRKKFELTEDRIDQISRVVAFLE